jgi:hypothetical protein
MYINNEILSVDQIWNQRVLDVFIKMEENNYLVNSGSKKFVELYNDVAKNKNYNQAFTILNL